MQARKLQFALGFLLASGLLAGSCVARAQDAVQVAASLDALPENPMPHLDTPPQAASASQDAAPQTPEPPHKLRVLTPNTDAASTSAGAHQSQPVSTMFPHPDSTWWWISGQANFIFQGHPGFHSPLGDQGTNSFTNGGEYKTSMVGTLFLGARFYHSEHTNSEFLYHEESAAGRGLSQALGLAGFTNLDVVRNPNLGPTPYMARAEIHETIGFGSEEDDVTDERGPFSLATKVPMKRLEMRVGKMSTVDTFDVNGVGSDSHLQFSDWAVDNNGAYDYAADTRGYSYGAIAEYHDKNWSARYGLMLMPTVANGLSLDWSVKRARGEQAEQEVRRSFITGRSGTYRLLEYWNHAHMGEYREAVNAYLSGQDPVPEITHHEHFGAVKYGFGLNGEQEISNRMRVFGRIGWNEGQHESFAYTEIDQTFLVGGDCRVDRWGRVADKVGVAFVTDAIKKDHQTYLKLGGLGFILGDGNLHYAREDIFEAYYNAHAWRGLYFALQQFYIAHPGYNSVRGPVYVGGVRAHVDF